MNHAIEPRSVLTTIKRFLGDPAPAGRRNRSRAGVIVSILIVPLLLGVMACFVLPVPIGDPEKSRVDPAMSSIIHVTSQVRLSYGSRATSQPSDSSAANQIRQHIKNPERYG